MACAKPLTSPKNIEGKTENKKQASSICQNLGYFIFTLFMLMAIGSKIMSGIINDGHQFLNEFPAS